MKRSTGGRYRTRAALNAALLTIACVSAPIAQAQQAAWSTGNGQAASFVSGGIGVESRAELADIEQRANLKLVFTEPLGTYLSDVGVKVMDPRGNVLIETVSGGPWMLARLAPGTYKIVVKDGGTVQERHVAIGNGLRTEQFRLASHTR